MKRTCSILLLLLICNSASAQLFTKERIKNQENFDKQVLTWGYFLGFNSYDFKFDYVQDLEDIMVKTNIGFSVGLVGDMRLAEHFNLRFEPGLYMSQRELQYPEGYFQGTPNASALHREVKSTYIHFPLLLKVSTKRLNNFKPFVVGGLSTALNLSSNENNPDDNHAGQFRSKKQMFFYEVGFGVDFYLEWFKFTPSIRGVFAINDELVRDADPDSPWTRNIDAMKTRGVFVNFTFQ